MLKLTDAGAEIVDASLIPRHEVIYVEDKDYLFLSRDKSASKELLAQLAEKHVFIDRLGNKLSDGARYERKDIVLTIPNVPTRKEMGYHHRL